MGWRIPMITEVKLSLEYDKELIVTPDWDGDTDKFVTLIIKDLNPEQQNQDGVKEAVLSITLEELKNVVKAAEVILEGQKV
jgi:hypothetical protein